MSLLLASLSLPAAAESRFGLGLDLFFEHQESLEVSAFRGTILTRDLLRGGEQSADQPSDPALLNRKFDLVWELEATAVELPINLPGLGGVKPKLVLQAGVADVSLDFFGRRDPADNAALSGRGPLFGAELELEGSPWGSGPWSAGASLRWQKVPSLTMDRSPAFRPEGFEAIADGVQPHRQGFEVIGDDVSLGEEVQEFTMRVGYSASSGKAMSYVGVQHRRTTLNIEDELVYVDPLREIETRLASHTGLESDATLAVVGVETRAGPHVYGRVETAIGEGDRIVLAKVVYTLPTEIEKKERLRDQEILNAIAQPLAQIEAEFLAGWHGLTIVEGPDGNPAYFVREVQALLTRTESDLLTVLSQYAELEALSAWVRYEFDRSRIALELDRNGATVGIPFTYTGSGLTLIASRDQRPTARFVSLQVIDETLEQRKADEELIKLLEGPIMTLVRLPEDGLSMQLTFRTTLGRGTTLFIYPMEGRRDAVIARRLNRDEPMAVKKGSYWFDVDKADTHLACCGQQKCALGNCPLQLAIHPCLLLACDNLECRKRERCR